MKKFLAVLLAAASLALVGCSQNGGTPAESGVDLSESSEPAETQPALTVPDVIGVDEATAKNVVSALGIIPLVEYGYTNDVEYGIVYGTSPEVGAGVNAGTKITLYVSEGVESATAVNSTIAWYIIEDSNNDQWNGYLPYIENGKLILDYYDVTFGADMTWDDEDNDGYGFGRASLNSTFDQTVPLTLKYETKANKAGTPQNFTVEIPLTTFDVDKPTDMNMYACYLDSSGNQHSLYFSVSIEW